MAQKIIVALADELDGGPAGETVTEEVPEFYHCDSYEPRIPGTGYRG